MVDDADIGSERESAIENAVDNAATPIRLVYGRHEEDDPDTMPAADRLDRAHVAGNLRLIAGPQASFAFQQRIFIQNRRLGVGFILAEFRTDGTIAPQATPPCLAQAIIAVTYRWPDYVSYDARQSAQLGRRILTD